MKAQSITLSLVVLGVVALCTPRQDTAAGNLAAKEAEKPATFTWEEAIGERPAALNTTTLKREDDGHFYADVRIDGRPVPMLVDTGASFIALTPDDAEAARVDYRESEAVVVGNGASGPVRGVPVTLREVKLGDHRARDVQAAVILDGLPVSLLGQSFLRQVEAVRIEGDRMVLAGR